MPGPAIGTNLTGLVDWTTAFPFIDLMKTSRTWYTQSDSSFDTHQAALLDLDANGWVRDFTRDGTDAPFQRVCTILNTSGQLFRPGTYVLDWQGAGSVDVGGVAADDILARTAHSITIRIDSNSPVQININSTDPNNSGNYIRDIRFYNQADHDLLDAGITFNPAMLDRIQDFRVLRFMDWMDTNNSTVDAWDDMRPGNYVTQGTGADGYHGASIETMVALANQTRTDPWFNIPHQADANYIRQFATYVRDHLDAGLVARFEFSNEVWNWGFGQAQYALQQATARWGPDDQSGFMQWYGMKAAQMARIVASVFGDETGTRALNVFATQSGYQGIEQAALDAPLLVAEGGTAPRDAPFHVYAIAPYFGGAIGQTSMSGQIDAWIAQGEAGYRAAIAFIRHGNGQDTLDNVGATIAYHAHVAEALGWQLEAYEGGQHILDLETLFGGANQADPAQTAFFTNLVKRPEFRQLYLDYLQIWKDAGGGLMAQFSDFGIPGPYGSWGIWDSVYSPDTPRSQAIEIFRDTTDVWWGDTRPATTFDNGLIKTDATNTGHLNGTRLGDALFGLSGNDTLFGTRGGDTMHGGAGRDVVDFGATGSRVIVDLLTPSANMGLARGDHYWSVEVFHGTAFADAFFGDANSNTFVSNAGADRLVGRGGNDNLLAGDGNDTLFGGVGNDTLRGGAANDLLFGGDGNDSLTSTLGNDRFSGGAGADDFLFAKGTGRDVITDFQRGVDDLMFARALVGTATTGAQVVARFAHVVSGDVVFIFADGSRVVLDGIGSVAGLSTDISII
jgi:Ca2+-binding RTX toxin-like protein